MLDHSVEDFNGEKILLILVKESETKPAHLRGDPNKAFVRSCGTSRKASRAELGAFMLNSKTPKWEELRASSLIPDAELPNKLDTVTIFKLLERKEFSSAAEVFAWLETEKFISREPAGGGYLTNLGAIAAAHKLSEFPDLARKAVRVVTYSGFDKSKAKEEKVGQKGYAVGFQGLLKFIVNALPKSEVIKNALRIESPVYPEIALREIIANALVHQDFSITGTGPLIEIYDDRIEVSNPGSLLPSKEPNRLIGTQPESRNQELANAFMRYRICEQRGSGLIKAGLQAEFCGLPPIEFFSGPNYFKVTLHSPRTFAEMTGKERLAACYQHATLRHVGRAVMTNKSLRERLKMSEKQRSKVSMLIQDAITEGLIKVADPQNKSKKYAEYLPYWA